MADDLEHPQVTEGHSIFRPPTGYHQAWTLWVRVWIPEAVGSVIAPALWPGLVEILWQDHSTPVLLSGREVVPNM